MGETTPPPTSYTPPPREPTTMEDAEAHDRAQKNAAATKIQAQVRAKNAKKEVKKLKAEKHVARKKAAAKLQAAIRATKNAKKRVQKPRAQKQARSCADILARATKTKFAHWEAQQEAIECWKVELGEHQHQLDKVLGSQKKIETDLEKVKKLLPTPTESTTTTTTATTSTPTSASFEMQNMVALAIGALMIVMF